MADTQTTNYGLYKIGSVNDAVGTHMPAHYNANQDTIDAALAETASDLATHANNSNIHVTAAQKSTWDAKQNAIPANTYDAYGAADAAASMAMRNPNIVDNWFFAGGGSQQNGYQFPINARGQTSYSAGVQYTIDRWKTSNSYTTVSIEADGVTISASSGSTPYLLQKIANAEQLLGKKVTLSVLMQSGFYSKTATLPTSNPDANAVYASVTSVMDILYSAGVWSVRLKAAQGGNNTYIAVKLELGDTQTLAHQENGVWVLNEIPNYADQQLRCCRYYLRLPNLIRYPLTRYSSSGKQMDFLIPVPIRMVGTPTIENSSLFAVAYGASASDSGDYSFSIVNSGDNAISVRATAASGVTIPSISTGICLQISTGAAITSETQ